MAIYMKILVPVSGNDNDIKVTAVDFDGVAEKPAPSDHLREEAFVDLNELHTGASRKSLAVIFHAKINPDCVYYIGGKKYRVC
ncbi:MAG TPA: hypothetical protein VNO43_05140 [Candidatus Eisenbacteria bacterium]|nr:hypothetical protein [Candidatus Eisenbacteria bacterium]